MEAFYRIAEQRIKEAMANGAFDNLKGKGRPLVFEDDSFVPQDLKMAYKILKNAGFLPPEIEAEKEIKKTEDLLVSIHDEKMRYKQAKKLNVLITKANMLRKRPISLEKHQIYYQKIVERMSIKKE